MLSLEYNEKQKEFHINHGMDPSNKDWVVLFPDITEKGIVLFMDFIDNIYPNGTLPDLEMMKNLVRAFSLVDKDTHSAISAALLYDMKISSEG